LIDTLYAATGIAAGMLIGKFLFTAVLPMIRNLRYGRKNGSIALSSESSA